MLLSKSGHWSRPPGQSLSSSCSQAWLLTQLEPEVWRVCLLPSKDYPVRICLATGPQQLHFRWLLSHTSVWAALLNTLVCSSPDTTPRQQKVSMLSSDQEKGKIPSEHHWQGIVLLQVGILLRLKRVCGNTHKESLPVSHSLETKVQFHYIFLSPVIHMVTLKVTLKAMFTVDMKMHLKKIENCQRRIFPYLENQHFGANLSILKP